MVQVGAVAVEDGGMRLSLLDTFGVGRDEVAAEFRAAGWAAGEGQGLPSETGARATTPWTWPRRARPWTWPGHWQPSEHSAGWTSVAYARYQRRSGGGDEPRSHEQRVSTRV